MKSRNGLTLIEVIVTIAIIGIISIPLSNAFNTGLKNIVRAGDRTEAMYDLQEAMDYAIKRVESKDHSTLLPSSEPYPNATEKITIHYTSSSSNVEFIGTSKTMEGIQIKAELKKDTSKSLTTFVPDDSSKAN